MAWQSYYYPDYIHTNFTNWFKNIRMMDRKLDLDDAKKSFDATLQAQRSIEQKVYQSTGVNNWQEFEQKVFNEQFQDLSKDIGRAKQTKFNTKELVTRKQFQSMKQKNNRIRTPKSFRDDFAHMKKETAQLYHNIITASEKLQGLVTKSENARQAIIDGKAPDVIREYDIFMKQVKDFQNFANKIKTKSFKPGEGNAMLKEDETKKAIDFYNGLKTTALYATMATMHEYAMVPMLATVLQNPVIHTGKNVRKNVEYTVPRYVKADLQMLMDGWTIGFSLKGTSERTMREGEYGASLHSGSLGGLKELVQSSANSMFMSDDVIDQIVWFIVNYFKLSTAGTIRSEPAILNGKLEEMPGYHELVEEPLRMLANVFVGDSLANKEGDNDFMQNDFLVLKDRIFPKSEIMSRVMKEASGLKMDVSYTRKNISQTRLIAFDDSKKAEYRGLEDHIRNREHAVYTSGKVDFSSLYKDYLTSKIHVRLKGSIDYGKLTQGGV